MKLKKIGLTLAFTAAVLGLASCGTKNNSSKSDDNKSDTGDNTTGDNTSGGNTSGGDTTGGNTSGGNTSGGDTTGGNTSGGNTSGGDTTGGNTSGGNTSGGNTSGGDSTGGNTSGGNTSGGDTTGGNTSGNGSSTGALDSGNGHVNTVGSINVTSCSGEKETAYVEFEKYSNAVSYNIYAKNKNDVTYELLDSKDVYVQQLSSGIMRADLFGLPGGDYSIKVCPVTETGEISNPTVIDVNVVAYDRSGYAHFNYTNGIGAYNDDGTLKENAMVIYVTDETKNTVELTYGGLTVKGIGNILNTVGQKCGEVGHENECRKVSDGKTYYAKGNENGGILKKLADANIPLAVRMVGLISESGNYEQKKYDAADSGLIDGLTEYDSNDYGGSVGDNGHMARMKSAKDVTIEGVGTNAGLDGWGLHFMCESSYPELGKSFETRNLVFMNTPEDAIGMEGVQEGGIITASVERVWVHHNTFLAPEIGSPAESDKAEGDGSCDFKRGQYFTMSYNYFEYCHKTNLIGSADSSLQYNLSYHHNLWYNCGSRIPLLRQSNIHFYNNYVYGDSNDKSTSLSYVTSLRANCYMYAENNYYEGCKNVFTDGKSGTGAKLYGNIMVQCFGDQVGTIVDDRETSVSSSCAYNGTSYANFDTNSALFYYNSQTKQSNCYLTTAEVAREEVIKYAGSAYRTTLNKTTLKTTDYNFNDKTPTTSVTVGSITLPTAKGEQTVSNIVWSGITGVSSGTVKGRGKIATFKVDKYLTLNIKMTGSSSAALNAGAVVNSQGKVMIAGSGSVVLAPGIYTIVSCQKDKDTTIESISFETYDSEALKQELINEYNEAYNAIPSTITFTNDCYEAIKNAINAYNALGSYKSEVTTTPYDAFNQYIALNKAYVENLISEIGTVSSSSSQKIVAARAAYNQLITKDNTVVVSNYDVLVQAEAEYENFAVAGAIDLINAIGTVTLDSSSAINLARTAYDSLNDTQKAQVTNYSVLTAAEATYESLVNVKDVNDLIANTATTASLGDLKDVIDAYDALTTTEKSQITDTAKLSTIKVNYVIALINTIPATVTTKDGAVIKSANTAYNALTATEQSQVTNYSVLQTATEAYEAALAAGVSSVNTSDFSDTSSWTITGETTSTTNGLIGNIWSGNTITATSKFIVNGISTINMNVTISDKGTSAINVYTSTDGETWTLATTFTVKSNGTSDVSGTLDLQDSVYVKLEITCTKSSGKVTGINTLKIN